MKPRSPLKTRSISGSSPETFGSPKDSPLFFSRAPVRPTRLQESTFEEDDPNEMREAQDTPYWDTFRRTLTYELRIQCHRAVLVTLDNSATPPDTYVIIFKKDDRAGTKTKTGVAKKTTYPDWEELLVLEDLHYDDEIVAEVKHSNTLGGNLVLGKFSFFVHETLGMKDDTIPKLLEPFGSGELTLSITCLPPVPWGGPLVEPLRTETVLKPVYALRQRPDLTIGELDPFYLRTDNAGYACLFLDGDSVAATDTLEERLMKLVPSRRRAFLRAGLHTMSIVESPHHNRLQAATGDFLEI
eukprot:scaffold2141_cov282-Pinguiococcus_pyrenoidosus.AAC.40